MKINWKTLIICFVIVYLTAFLGGIFTSKETSGAWYDSVRPSITPPNYVFPIVWNILFFLIAVSLYIAWDSGKDRLLVGFVFGANFVLNILWSVLYFGLRNPLLAFFEIIVLWLSICSMIYVCWKIDRKAAWLLVPYLLWVGFAIVLNYLSI